MQISTFTAHNVYFSSNVTSSQASSSAPDPARPAKRHRSDHSSTDGDSEYETSKEYTSGEEEEDAEVELPETAEYASRTSPSASVASPFKLPSGLTVQSIMSCCQSTGATTIELDNVYLRKVFSARDHAHLKSFLPKLPKPGAYFEDCLKACEAVTKRPAPPLGHCFTAPAYRDPHDHLMWTYVHNAASHFGCHHADLVSLGAIQAEVFADVNIWNYLWDSAFLKSEKLVINRKEINTLQGKKRSGDSVGPRTVSIKHDGIIHARLPPHRDLGFIEVKPLRIHQGNKYMKADREKIIDSMTTALLTYNVPGVMVVGVLCEGFKMNILRATLVKGHVLITETEESVELDRILTVIRRCWRIKLALEESYYKFVAAAEPESD